MGHLDSHVINEYKIYTYGSKTSNCVALAMVRIQPRVPNVARNSRIHEDSSIHSWALCHTVCYPDGCYLGTGNHVCLFELLKSSIQAVYQLYSGNPLINKIEGKGHDSVLPIVLGRAHSDITGNEIVVKLARKTFESRGKINKPHLRSDLGSTVKSKTWASWLLKWKFLSERIYHFIQVTDDLSPLLKTENGRKD